MTTKKDQHRLIRADAMKPDLIKICSDSLRTFSKEKYNVKLKAAHAHELVAAFCGYKTKNGMLADTQHPISNLGKAEIIVMTPDNFIAQRRQDLDGLVPDLPDTYTLGEAVYVSLFTGEWWRSQYPPFRSFEMLAKYLTENNDAYQNMFKFYRDIPMHHIVEVKDEEDSVTLSVTHAHQTQTGEMIGDGQTTIKLRRVAGRIGYGKPQISVESWSGGARRPPAALGWKKGTDLFSDL